MSQGPDEQRDWCAGCGLCCMHMRSPPHQVFLVSGVFRHCVDVMPDFNRGQESDEADTEFALIASAPREARQRAARMMADDSRSEGSPCSWLDLASKRCRWYRHRPAVCRDFKVGGRSCCEQRQAAGLSTEGMPVVLPEEEP